MSQKVAAISGGAKNIGKGITLRLLSENWNVAVIDIDKKSLDKLENSGKLLKFHGDDSIEKDVKIFYENVKEKFGRLDLIVNNAAIGGFRNF